MIRVAKSSTDGSVHVTELVVEGVAYDRPPWIIEPDFRAGLQSNDPDNALAALTACSIHKWDGNEPIFALEFTVPFGTIQELVLNCFTPVPAYSGGEVFTEINDADVTITMLASEYRDFNDVQAVVLPLSFKNTPYGGTGQYSRELYEALQKDLPGIVQEAVGWSGKYEEFTTSNDELYFFLLKVHED